MISVLQMVKEQQSIPMQQIDSNTAARKNLDDIVNRLSDLQNHSTQAEAISTKAVNMMDDLTENVVDSIKVRLVLCPMVLKIRSTYCFGFEHVHQTLTHLSQIEFLLIGTFHFHFKGCWVAFFVFIKILIEHSVSKEWRP